MTRYNSGACGNGASVGNYDNGGALADGTATGSFDFTSGAYSSGGYDSAGNYTPPGFNITNQAFGNLNPTNLMLA